MGSVITGFLSLFVALVGTTGFAAILLLGLEVRFICPGLPGGFTGLVAYGPILEEG
ncbi:MAG: hypothetical protein Q4D79_13505 [Propionibacteriaceae bacterium]|nr:hypothetical protein [Propionibacteriaceae bacterium]